MSEDKNNECLECEFWSFCTLYLCKNDPEEVEECWVE